MNFKQLKDFDFKNIDIDRNQFERITVGVIILCALSLFLVTIKTQHSIRLMGLRLPIKVRCRTTFEWSRNFDL